MKRITSFFKLMKISFREFSNDNGLKLSASLSYYTVFALGPMLIVIIALAGIFFGRAAIEGKIYTQLSGLVGSSAAAQVQEIITNIEETKHNVAGAIIGAIILVIGATGVFTEIQGSINYIWSVRSKPKKGLLKFLINRVLSFSLVVSFGFLLMVSLLANSMMDLLLDHLKRFFADTTIYLFYITNIVIIYVVTTILFTIIFKILPDASIRWKDAFKGSLFTAFLFLLGKFIIGIYVGKSSIGATYGAAASIIILLSWVYYSSIILYFGAEFTRMYAILHGHGITPSSTAVFIIKQEAKEISQQSFDEE
jgi:membrane protein